MTLRGMGISETSVKTANASQSQVESKALAPAWHTAGALLLFLGFAAASLYGTVSRRAQHPHNRALGYFIGMAIEWLIVGFIALGARWQGASLRTLAGEFSPSWRAVLRDLGLAIAYLVAANIVLGILSSVLGLHPASSGFWKNLLPQTALEWTVFFLYTLTAGICEETIFRGYLQRQFTGWTGNAAAGIVLQGILFGAAHAYQGPSQMILIAFDGCMFGSLAYWRKSLRPGMLAHFIQDSVGGIILARVLVK